MLGGGNGPDAPATIEMWLRLVHPDDRPQVLEDLEAARRGRGPFHSEHRIVRADDGRIAWLRASGRFFYDATGTAVRFLGAFFDDTQRMTAEEEV